MKEGAQPSFDQIRDVIQHTRSERAAEERLVQTFGTIPDVWMNPVIRSELRESPLASTVLSAHVNNFGQAYETKLGTQTVAIADLRNIAGQGMPGELAWRREMRER